MFDVATAFAIFSAILLAGLLKGIIGVGFQTVGIAFLTVITNLPNAISLLLIPSLVTNLWQAGAGGELFTILIRLWPLIITASMMVWFGSIALTSVSLSYLSVLLGVLLIIYSTFSLFGLRFEVKTKNEWWLAPFIGLINGVLTNDRHFCCTMCFLFSGNWISQSLINTVNGGFIHGINPDADCFTQNEKYSNLGIVWLVSIWNFSCNYRSISWSVSEKKNF